LHRSRLIVASRAGAGRSEVQSLTGWLPGSVRDRVLYLDFPTDLGEHSATRVRQRVRAGESINGLAHPAVERFINERGLYR